MNKLIFTAALPIVLLLGLAGCNTVGGLGKDLQQIGGVIAGTATGVQAASTPGRPAQPDGATTSQTSADSCQPDTNGIVLAGCPDPQPSPH